MVTISNLKILIFSIRLTIIFYAYTGFKATFLLFQILCRSKPLGPKQHCCATSTVGLDVCSIAGLDLAGTKLNEKFQSQTIIFSLNRCFYHHKKYLIGFFKNTRKHTRALGARFFCLAQFLIKL